MEESKGQYIKQCMWHNCKPQAGENIHNKLTHRMLM